MARNRAVEVAARRIRLARGAFVAQASITTVAAATAFLVALVTAASGTRWLVLAGSALAVAAALTVLAGLLVWLRSKVGSLSVRSTLMTALIEALLLTGGLRLASIATAANEQAGTAQNPGTDGPFADGMVGVIGLMGFAYVFGAILVLGALSWEQIRRLWVSREARAR